LDKDAASEATLARAARGGDTRAFGALVARYRPRCYGYFMARLGDADESDDLCQETFVRAFAGLRGLREPERFGAWLFAVARNCLRRRAAGRGAEAARRADLTDDLVHEDAAAAWDGFDELARVAVAMLDEELRLLVDLRYGAGLSYAAVADPCQLALALDSSDRQVQARFRAALAPDLLAGLAAAAAASRADNRAIEDARVAMVELLRTLETAGAVVVVRPGDSDRDDVGGRIFITAGRPG
jgi:RNA polymerase sigma-70 factor (ECF subfamily)